VELYLYSPICFHGVYMGTFLPVIMLFSSPSWLCVLLLSYIDIDFVMHVRLLFLRRNSGT